MVFPIPGSPYLGFLEKEKVIIAKTSKRIREGLLFDINSLRASSKICNSSPRPTKKLLSTESVRLMFFLAFCQKKKRFVNVIHFQILLLGMKSGTGAPCPFS